MSGIREEKSALANTFRHTPDLKYRTGETSEKIKRCRGGGEEEEEAVQDGGRSARRGQRKTARRPSSAAVIRV